MSSQKPQNSQVVDDLLVPGFLAAAQHVQKLNHFKEKKTTLKHLKPGLSSGCFLMPTVCLTGTLDLQKAPFCKCWKGTTNDKTMQNFRKKKKKILIMFWWTRGVSTKDRTFDERSPRFDGSRPSSCGDFGRVFHDQMGGNQAAPVLKPEPPLCSFYVRCLSHVWSLSFSFFVVVFCLFHVLCLAIAVISPVGWRVPTFVLAGKAKAAD